MKDKSLAELWNAIPLGKENALTYTDMFLRWGVTPRKARAILHDLSLYDSGDDFILIRSARSKGFYRTDNRAEIEAYKRECLAKGRSVFAPIKKINRVLYADGMQYNFINNLRVIREQVGMTQAEVCEKIKDIGLDKFLLSKMENNICLPTEYQLRRLAEIYGCRAVDLVEMYLLDDDNKTALKSVATGERVI